MARGRRERSALGVATALHGALIVSLGLWASHHPRVLVPLRIALPAAPRADEFDVDWSAAETAALAPPSPLPSLRASPVRPRAEVGGVGTAPSSPPHSDQPVLPAEPSGVSRALPPEAAANEPERAIDLGLGPDGYQRFLRDTAGDAKPVTRPVARPLFRMPQPSDNGGLREGLEAHDRAVGMGSSGPALRALFEASHGDRAPATGLARFQITVLKSGAVAVSLRDATSELAGWRTVAVDAESRLRKAPPRVPKGRNGVRMLLEITADNQLPNGLKQTQLKGPHVELNGPKFRSTADAQKDLEDHNPLAGEQGGTASGTVAISDLPGVYIAQTGRVCGYRVGLSALGPVLQGGCDLSNLGARPVRMVHTRVVEEATF